MDRSAAPPGPAGGSAVRFALWVLLGSLLLQTAWVLALPPFRGIDEFDHAYRAAAVADGQWLPSGRSVPDGRGELLSVPPGMVRDAGPVCSELGYTGRYNCEPYEIADDGRAVVASAASRYNPVFYWVLGTAARPFDGAAALTAMRAVDVLLCSLALAAGAWVTARWARTVWPRLGFVAALTPVTVYGGAVAAPNALETVAALGVWTCLLGLRQADEHDRRRFLVLAAALAVPLAGLRGLGPLWLAMIVLVAAAWVGPAHVLGLLRAHRRVAAVAAAAVVAVTAAASAWTLIGGSLDLESGGSGSGGVPATAVVQAPAPGAALDQTARAVPLWLLQSVAAFPLRDEQAPTVVYATGVLVMGGLLGLGLVRAGRRDRLLLLLALLAGVAVPFVLQVQAYDVAGMIWQGRYGWPFGLGVLLMAGAALDTRPPRHPLVLATVPVALAMWAVAHAVSVAGVLLGERRGSPYAGDERWLSAPVGVVTALAVLGVLAWAVGALRPGADEPPSPPDRAERLPAPGAGQPV